jgi:hypothetical protein
LYIDLNDGGRKPASHTQEASMVGQGGHMPDKDTLERAKKDRREGKAASTQAGEFVREEIEHVREGKHGARSAKQAIAIGLSKARRAGIDLPPPKEGTTSEETRRSAERAYEAGQAGDDDVSPTRSRAIKRVLKREGRSAASPRALAKQAHAAAARRTASERSAAARKAARTKGAAGRSAAARKAARTRARG